MEMIRLAFVYVHLIACCVALGAILKSDATMLSRLVQGRGDEPDEHLTQLARLVSIALAILWATGAYLIWADASAAGLAETLANPKLQAKIILVTILTINGLLLHFRILPMLSRAGSLLQLGSWQRNLALAAGVLSGVSWMYAAFMGIARPLAWKYPLAELLQPYPVLIVATFAAMWLLTARALRLDGTPGRLVGAPRS